MSKLKQMVSHARQDVPAGAVVFLVALPLCLGIAQASHAPLVAGLWAGIIGGLIVPLISRSPLSVAGPAAGLTVLVASAIADVGVAGMAAAVVIAGVLQIVLGAARVGLIAHFLPSAVIKGMLAAIGLLIILKQLPHAVGYDRDYEGDLAFRQPDGENTFSSLTSAMSSLTLAAIIISGACLAIALAWPMVQRKLRAVRALPAPLMVVLVGAGLATLLVQGLGMALEREHYVDLPMFASFADVRGIVNTPALSWFTDGRVWTHGLTIGIVASLETLLALEAVDRLDPHKRISPPNLELAAQGVANTLSGLVGGLPITSVIVRSSANVQAGGQTRLAAIVHGGLLLVGMLFLAFALNQVPLAALAIVLIVVGFKLTAPSLWISMWRQGWSQFVPFAVTVAAIMGTDLLKGTALGALVGLVFMIRAQQKDAVDVVEESGRFFVRFNKDMSFLQKAKVKEVLREIPDGAYVMIDRQRIDYIDHDIEELVEEFVTDADARNITVEQQYEPGGEARAAQRRKFRTAGAH